VLADVVVLGGGSTWDEVAPDDSEQSITWDDIGVSTRTWIDIFELTASSQVSMRVYYGDALPLSLYVDRMEILSAILTARYFRVEITILDPSAAINALVENFTLKFCQ